MIVDTTNVFLIGSDKINMNCVFLLYINKVYMLYEMKHILDMVLLDGIEVEIEQLRGA